VLLYFLLEKVICYCNFVTCNSLLPNTVHGTVLFSFTDVKSPWHLSSDSEGHVLVADYHSHSILLLNSKLQLQRVLVDRNSQVKLRWPSRLCYDELASRLYFIGIHSSESGSSCSTVITLVALR